MDPTQLAKTARAQLALALNALQSTDDAPDQLMEVAEPIAQAMSILHKIERSAGATLDGREVVLKNIRNVLQHLQSIETYHSAVDAVMEAVAGSLAKAHALVRYTPAPQPQPAAVQPNPVVALADPVPAARAHVAAPLAPQLIAAPQPVIAPQPIVPPQPIAAPQPVIAPQPILSPQPVIAPQPIVSPQPIAAPQPVIAPQPILSPQPVIAPQPILSPQPVVASQPAAPQPIAVVQPAPIPAPAPLRLAHPIAASQPTALPQPIAPQPIATPQPVAPQPALPQRASSAPQAGRPRTFDVELGTHSASNFYKGLGGNDVIDAGGIFVATYKVPNIGATVNLRVLLPGDYEFQATGVVQWTRETGMSGESQPGFGARFTQIGAEGRQLVYRYTRNREPMFYDDL